MRFSIFTLGSLLLGSGVQATGVMTQYDAAESFEPFLGGDELLQLDADADKDSSNSFWKNLVGAPGKAGDLANATLNLEKEIAALEKLYSQKKRVHYEGEVYPYCDKSHKKFKTKFE